MAYYASSIDDSDSAFIYSGGWELVTEDGDWRGTMHSTYTPGSYARVRFTGSRVAAVFTIPTGDGNSIAASFSIDNGPAVTRSRATTGPVQWNYLLFDSGPLPYGNHLLVITYASTEGYLRIDRVDYDPTPNSAPTSAPPVVSKTTTVQAPPTTVIVVTSGPPNSNTPPASVGPSSTPSATEPSSRPAASWVAQPPNTNSNSNPNPNSTPVSGAPSVPTSLSTATPTSPIDANAAPNPTTGTQSKSSGPSAALIGGVLGAVVVILLILLAGIFIVRQRRKHARSRANSTNGAAPNTPTSTVPTPFDVSMRNMSTAHLVSRGHMTSPSGSGTDYSSPTSNMYTSGQASASTSASLATHHRPDAAFDSTMMASAKQVEHLQESQTSTTSPGASSEYASYGTNPQRLSAFTDYVPPPAYQ
ncbi:hypothetical protein D9619_010384 [Psilocybe cf. subviscida]|uniref:Uncharacterized protein n=1 Tax=Psilocybe cf. subviscida TaxID=2480587 RepID=A0A8H5ERQ9_9AGAR|nr:hypothetical protein D9619_010384 [Psilocybe cf. subviscida]